MILKSDGVTLITAVETTVQGKGTVDNISKHSWFFVQVLSMITRQAEQLRLFWQRNPQPKRASEVQRGILTIG